MIKVRILKGNQFFNKKFCIKKLISSKSYFQELFSKIIMIIYVENLFSEIFEIKLLENFFTDVM